MQNETLAASAAKVTAVTSGTLVSMVPNSGAIGAAAGILAASYSALQIIKSLPWLTDYFIALRSGLIHHDWRHWRSISRRNEKEDEEQHDQSVKP